MKTIIVTGTPGTGKSALARHLAKTARFLYIDVNFIIALKKLGKGFDLERKCQIIDEKQLRKALLDLIQLHTKKRSRGIIIDSHLSTCLPRSKVDLCIVTTCSLKTLQKRLKKRRYSEEKIRENLDCEIFDVCLMDAQKKKYPVLVIDASGPLQKTIRRLLMQNDLISIW